jgi:hypothetical protein
MLRNPRPADDSAEAGCKFSEVFLNLARHPTQIIRLWNWKSALLSLILRGPIFLVASIREGWEASLAAVVTESLFCVITAGSYGAIVQGLRNAEPQWPTVSFLTLVVPTMFQVVEYALHRFRGTPHLRLAEIVSVIISGLSALFNWYAMRRGTLLVGGEGDSFGKDLRRLPCLLLNFLIVLPGRIAERIGRRLSAFFRMSTMDDSTQQG